jgi:hypothetical protein
MIKKAKTGHYFGNEKTMWMFFAMLLLCAGCGYRVHSSIGRLPQGVESLGIPTFSNLTGQYKIEQLISGAVLKEFSLRTGIPVNSRSSGVDSVLVGEIRSLSSTPVAFGTQTAESQTFGSKFMITVEIGVKLVRLSDSSILWKNDKFLFRERYVLNENIRDFFSEENPALERLAQDFAASLASTVLDRSKP